MSDYIKKLSIHHDGSFRINVDPNRKEALIKSISIIGRLYSLESNPWGIHPENIDLIDLMTKLPKSSIKLLQEIKCRMIYSSNEARLLKACNKSQQNYRSLGLRKLKELNVIRKLGHNHLIVNTYLLVPPTEYQKKVIEKWESAK